MRSFFCLFILWNVVSYSEESWFVQGSQKDCNGSVAVGRALEICCELEEKREVGIHFNKDKVPLDLIGGTCSSMAITFLQTYLYRPSDIFDPRFYQSSQEMRDLQASYNTIEIAFDEEVHDISRAKVQSLLNYLDLKVSWASREIDIRKEEAIKRLALEEALLSGVYLIRVLLPEDNELLESRGHSFIYIKEEGKPFLYDPGRGLAYLEENSDFLFSLFTHYFKFFGVYSVRFYRIQSRV